MVILGILLVGLIALRYWSIIYYCSQLKKEIVHGRTAYDRTAIAQVAEVEEEQVDRSTTLYWPVFRFEAEGRTYQKSGAVFSDKKWTYQTGWYYEIRYDSRDPEKFMVADDAEAYQMAQRVAGNHILAIVVGGGLALLVAALG
ncbi:MAG: hypothetical protein KH230_17325 [Enterocloster asparagiformis]|nr:hypothetical protein [Enterocloster asparagiformis]